MWSAREAWRRGVEEAADLRAGGREVAAERGAAAAAVAHSASRPCIEIAERPRRSHLWLCGLRRALTRSVSPEARHQERSRAAEARERCQRRPPQRGTARRSSRAGGEEIRAAARKLGGEVAFRRSGVARRNAIDAAVQARPGQRSRPSATALTPQTARGGRVESFLEMCTIAAAKCACMSAGTGASRPRTIEPLVAPTPPRELELVAPIPRIDRDGQPALAHLNAASSEKRERRGGSGDADRAPRRARRARSRR